MGDREAAWPQYPAGSDADLWQALRLLWLFSLWATHSRASPSDRHPYAVVAGTVAAMRRLIREQWCFCSPGPSIFDVLPGRVLTRPVVEEEVAKFSAQWSGRGRFCVVDPPEDGAGAPTLRMLLTEQHPVPAPAAPSP
jgi:hypothetical protein